MSVLASWLQRYHLDEYIYYQGRRQGTQVFGDKNKYIEYSPKYRRIVVFPAIFQLDQKPTNQLAAHKKQANFPRPKRPALFPSAPRDSRAAESRLAARVKRTVAWRLAQLLLLLLHPEPEVAAGCMRRGDGRGKATALCLM